MRLVDAVFRQGHLSEQALIEAIMTGDRPLHLDRCDICGERAVEIGRWLDSVRELGHDAADAAFPPERLAAQHGQIMRRLEQLDQPSRVISFPAAPRPEIRESTGRRVAPAWVGVAAAAGLAIGLVGGQLTARLGNDSPAQQVGTTPQALDALVTGELSNEPGGVPTGPSLLDLNLDTIALPSGDVLDESTPSIVRTSLIRGG